MPDIPTGHSRAEVRWIWVGGVVLAAMMIFAVGAFVGPDVPKANDALETAVSGAALVLLVRFYKPRSRRLHH